MKWKFFSIMELQGKCQLTIGRNHACAMDNFGVLILKMMFVSQNWQEVLALK